MIFAYKTALKNDDAGSHWQLEIDPMHVTDVEDASIFFIYHLLIRIVY